MTTYWFDGCPAKTHFCNGLSALFPAWETAFAAIVNAYKEDITDPALRERMDKFIAQETAHGNAHHAHNIRAQVGTAEADEFAKVRLVLRKPKMRVWLAAMVSIEHIAATLSRYFLRTCGGRVGREFALFCWHSREELEHKSLALDLWDALGYSRAELKRLARGNFWYVMRFLIRYVVGKLRSERVLPSLRGVGRCLWLLGAVAVRSRDLADPTFHPDRIDDAMLIGKYA